mmetsp:Transcript_13890/g.21170  ORF Transcript_13890/g.21170 Transcript_13890/m.21170 type:complete len:343 (-) Transcript_13890:1683-2711(-)
MFKNENVLLHLSICLLVAFIARVECLERCCRRSLLKKSLLAGSTPAALSWIGYASQANAVQGAAEYDLEYYFRDLVNGNPKEGTRAASTGPPAPSPRTLQGPLLPLLLDEKCSESCVPTKALLDLLSSKQSSMLEEKIESIRSGAGRSFRTKAPWSDETVADQYYFDLTAYAFWKATADLLPDYKVRDQFARNIGRRIYASPLIAQKAKESTTAPLTSTIDSLTGILKLFEASRYIKAFKLGDDKTTSVLFDELDDDDLSNGSQVNCLISIYEPATLQASLQITGEQSRFMPDFVGTTLAAMWESVGISASYEIYFVDSEYRPNPKDFFPKEQLIQYTLTKK